MILNIILKLTKLGYGLNLDTTRKTFIKHNLIKKIV